MNKHYLALRQVSRHLFVSIIKIHYQQKEFGAFESRAKAFLEEDHQSENANDLLLMLGTYHFQQDRPEKVKPTLNNWYPIKCLRFVIRNSIRSVSLNW